MVLEARTADRLQMSREHISLELRITPLLFIFISRKRMFLFCWPYLCGFFSVHNGFVGFLPRDAL